MRKGRWNEEGRTEGGMGGKNEEGKTEWGREVRMGVAQQ